MATITSFEEMFSWQKARELNKIIYIETNQGIFNRDFALKDQIRRSSISIMSNIAEGFERASKREFKYFLNVAKGSTGEVRSQIYIAYDLSYINADLFTVCLELTDEICRLIKGFMNYLQRQIDNPAPSSTNAATSSNNS